MQTKVVVSGATFLAENQMHRWIPHKDIDDQRILQSDWTIVLWPLPSEAEFS